MFNVALAVLFIVLGIGLGLVYNKFIIRHYPDSSRKDAYVLTVVVFLVFFGVLYLIISVNSGTKATLTEYTIKMEQNVKDKHPDNGFVKDGLDLKGINDDISQISRTVEELKSLLPTYQELGVNRFTYNLIASYSVKELQKRLTVVNYSAKVVNTFTDRDNVLTVASVTNGLRTTAVKLINTICLNIAAVFVVLFLIYIIRSLVTVRKEKKRRKEETPPEADVPVSETTTS